MKYVIFGSRDFTDFNLLSTIIESTNSYKNGDITEIISGGAGGADSLGSRFAREHNIPLVLMLAEWAIYGRGAGYLRNTKMAEHADKGICFWDGQSRGTKQMLLECKKRGIPVLLYRMDKQTVEIV